MIDPYLESQYNVSVGRKDFENVLQDWSQRSCAYQSKSRGFSQKQYGHDRREVIDLFPTHSTDAPIVVYLHGGYWQRGDRAMYGFLAESFAAHGLNVAIIGYPLCPSVTMQEIVQSIKRSIIWLWKNAGDFEMRANSMILVGHSAGGHLAAIAQTTTWSTIDSTLPESIIGSVFAISGLFWLEPLLSTTIGKPLNLSSDDARLLSPAFSKPKDDVPMTVVIGGIETDEFFKQADLLENNWKRFGVHANRHIEQNVDHFDVINRLADPQSALFALVMSAKNTS